MAIAIPRLTIHKNKTKYNLNFYFNDDQHYLDIPNCLFVPENMVYTNERWLKNNIQEDYKVEIQNNIDDIIDKILKVSAKIATNQNFKNKHKFYLISKQQYEEWKK